MAFLIFTIKSILEAIISLIGWILPKQSKTKTKRKKNKSKHTKQKKNIKN